jgi:hypothetical protein
MHNFEQLYDFFSVQLEQERNSISDRKPENLYQPVVFTLDMMKFRSVFAGRL